MFNPAQLASSVVSLVCAHALLSLIVTLVTLPVIVLFIRPLFSPARSLPGPARASWFAGNWPSLLSEEPDLAHTIWSRQFGGAFAMNDYLGAKLTILADVDAVSHVLLKRASNYERPPVERGILGRLLGKGVIYVEGSDHARHRRIMAPAFSNAALKELDSVWWDVAARLRDQWLALVSNGEVDRHCFANNAAAEAYIDSKPEAEAMLDPQRWMSRATMDIIGLAGFGYAFDALESTKSNALLDTYVDMLAPRGKATEITPLRFFIERRMEWIINLFPFILPLLPDPRVRKMRKGLEHSRAQAREILQERKAERLEGGQGKDVLSLLLKSVSVDAKLQMSEDEMLAQMTTIILAGHETTATALTAALKLLTEHPGVQAKLRDEIVAATKRAQATGKNAIDGEDVAPQLMPYLEAVTKEVLRFESPVALLARMALNDDLIPLNTPIKDASGKTLTHVPVKKGQAFQLSVRALNFSKEVFGDDVDSFRPERWLEGTVGEKTSNPGVYSQLMTFSEGPRACIGWKLSVAEFKAILVTLAESFSFEKRDPTISLERRTLGIITKWRVVGEEELGFRVPIKVKVVSAE